MRSEKKKPDDSSARQVSGTEISMENFRQTETKKSAAKEEEEGGGGGGGRGKRRRKDHQRTQCEPTPKQCLEREARTHTRERVWRPRATAEGFLGKKKVT